MSRPTNGWREMVCAVIPAYKARSTVCGVVHKVLSHVDVVIVVDDGCPEGSAEIVEASFPMEPRVIVLRHPKNGGVGRAVKTGLAKALELNAAVVFKIDADDQMDVAYIPGIVELFEREPGLAFVKGNRFYRAQVLRRMPLVRLIGNSILSLWVKFSSGYWNLLDPTNGYLAFNASVLGELDWTAFADSYFFEISVLCALGLRHAPIAEVEMATIYNNERSSLSIRRVALEFPLRLAAIFLRRILLQYFVFDVNVGTLNLVMGTLLVLAGATFGAYEWAETAASGVSRSAGTIMLAALPVLMGFQLLLNALMYDVQFGSKSVRQLVARSHGTRATVLDAYHSRE